MRFFHAQNKGTLYEGSFKQLSLSGITKVRGYGDSYMKGSPDWCWIPDRFIDLFGAANSLTTTEDGYGGTGYFTATYYAGQYFNVGTDFSDMAVVVISGINNLKNQGASTKMTRTILGGLQHFLMNCISTNEVSGANFTTKSGTWTNSLTFQLGGRGGSLGSGLGAGTKNNVSGSYIEQAVSGNSIGVCYINTCSPGDASGSFDIYVDGVLKKSIVADAVQANGLPGDGDPAAFPTQPGAVIINGLSSGSHTLRIVNTSNNYVYIDYACGINASHAPVFVGLLPYMTSLQPGDWVGCTLADIDNVNTAITDLISTDYGFLPITCFDTNKNFVTATHEDDDGTHRNVDGNAVIFNELNSWVL